MTEAIEIERLSTLHGYNILDTPPERLFDEITEIAAEIFGVGNAMISLVERDRQWFKARCGFDRTETSLEESICRYAINGDDVLVLPDAAKDSRCADNPLVHVTREIGFYAGAPLIAHNGHRIGALCVFDRVPRQPEEWQVNALRNLASVVMRAFDAHRAGCEFRCREEYLLRLADRSPGGLFEFARDSQGRQWLNFASAGILDTVGVSPSEATADIANVFARVHPEDVTGLFASIDRAYEKRSNWRHEFRIQHPDKGTIWLLGSSEQQSEADGVITWQGCLLDITESVVKRQRLADAKAETERKNQELVEHQTLLWQVGSMAKVGACIVDLESGESHWSPTLFSIHEVEPTYEPGFLSAISFCEASYYKDVKGEIEATIREAKNLDIEYPIVTAKGNRRWVRSIATPEKSDDGRVIRLIGSFQDVTEERELLDRARHNADHDFLTGLVNRRRFLDRLAKVLAEAEPNQSHALFFFDLDYFKDINDALGYEAGDRFIVSVASRLPTVAERFGSEAIVSRFGGDEFVIFIANLDTPTSAVVAAQAISNEIGKEVMIDGRSVSTSTSMGLSLAPHDGTEPSFLLRNAELALRHAKRSGRRQFAVYTSMMEDEANADHLLKCDIVRGLSAGEFELHYQPIMNLATGSLGGFEALIRWSHPIRGLLNAGQFAHLLDEPGIVEKASEFVLQEVCATIAAWQDEGLDFGDIAINLTSAQLRSPLFRQKLQEKINQGIEPGKLKLEITEGVLLGRTADKAAETLESLRKMGFPIALDDFGTGYASLVHLTQFAIDQLKIDMSFVRKIRESEKNRTIVQAMCALANGLGIDAIAEGIEDAETEQMLRLMGCRYGQGYLYSKAVPRSDARRFLLEHAVETSMSA